MVRPKSSLQKASTNKGSNQAATPLSSSTAANKAKASSSNNPTSTTTDSTGKTASNNHHPNNYYSRCRSKSNMTGRLSEAVFALLLFNIVAMSSFYMFFMDWSVVTSTRSAQVNFEDKSFDHPSSVRISAQQKQQQKQKQQQQQQQQQQVEDDEEEEKFSLDNPAAATAVFTRPSSLADAAKLMAPAFEAPAVINLDGDVATANGNAADKPSHKGFQLNNNNNINRTVSLVTSFWAVPTSELKNMPLHRTEIEAAMLANLGNPFVNELVVVLDGVTEHANCQHFTDRMHHLYYEEDNPYMKQQQNQNQGGEPERDVMATLKCIEHKGEQPNYVQMLQYTQHPQVQGPAVVLYNADHVFDDTMQYAPYVKPNTIITLSSRGYVGSGNNNKSNGIPVSHRLLRRLCRTLRYSSHESCTKDLRTKRRGPAKHALRDRCIAHKMYHDKSESWDAYLFLKDTLKGKLDNQPQFFQRDGLSFFMNQNGAEDAALHDILEAANGQSPTTTSSSDDIADNSNNNNNNNNKLQAWNGCHFIYTFHFHFAPKMHKVGEMKVEEAFPKSWLRYTKKTKKFIGVIVPEPWYQPPFLGV